MFLNFRPLGAGCGAPVDDQDQVWLFLPGNPLNRRDSFADLLGQAPPFENRIAAPAEFDRQARNETFFPSRRFLCQPGSNLLNRFSSQSIFFVQPGC